MNERKKELQKEFLALYHKAYDLARQTNQDIEILVPEGTIEGGMLVFWNIPEEDI
jgi:hypothetical protein